MATQEATGVGKETFTFVAEPRFTPPTIQKEEPAVLAARGCGCGCGCGGSGGAGGGGGLAIAEPE